MTEPPEVIAWLDRVLGPPWSGLVVLLVIAALSGLSSWASIRTIRHIYRDK